MSVFDRILEDYIRPIGLWQWVIFFVVNLTTYGNLSMYPQLSSLLPNHHCEIPALEAEGWTIGHIESVAIPKRKINSSHFDSCDQYNISGLIHDLELNMTSFVSLDLARILAAKANKTLQVIPCQNGWYYNHKTTEFRHSFPESFNLVCKNRFLIPVTTSMYLIGTMVGRAGGGFLADRFGRKPVMMTASLITFVFGILVGFSNSVWMFSLFRFIVGVSSNAAVITGIVLWSEITNDKHRNTLGVIFGVHESFVIPSFNVLLAYLTQNWRLLHMLLVAYYGFSICHPCLIKDSPRWLLLNNRVVDAMAVIRRAIRWNRGPNAVNEKTLKEIEAELQAFAKEQVLHKAGAKSKPWYRSPALELFTKRCHWPYTYPLLMVWFVIMMGVIGFPFYSVRLKHSNPYLVAFVGFFVSLPAMFLKYLLYNYFDRKRPLIGVFLVCALSCVVQSILRGFGIQGASAAVLATISLCSALVAQNMAYTFTTECFPTSSRNYATGLTTGLGRLGAVVATFVTRLDHYVWAPLPMLIFTVAFVLAAMMVFIIPDVDVSVLSEVSVSSEDTPTLKGDAGDSASDGGNPNKKSYGTTDDREALTKEK